MSDQPHFLNDQNDDFTDEDLMRLALYNYYERIMKNAELDTPATMRLLAGVIRDLTEAELREEYTESVFHMFEATISVSEVRSRGDIVT